MNHSNVETPDLALLLSDLFLFRDWSEADRDAVYRVSHLMAEKKGASLFLQERPCDSLYFLVRGKVQMYRLLPDGQEVTLQVLGPDSLVACAALFLDRAYPASARVSSSIALLVRLEGRAFLKMIEQRPDLGRKMIAALATRLSVLTHSIESHASRPSHARLAEWLLEQPAHREKGAPPIVRIEGSKKSLAAQMGITPETFSRCLNKLATEGILAVRNKDIILLDTARLAEVSGVDDSDS